jgi:hypothetical protein
MADQEININGKEGQGFVHLALKVEILIRNGQPIIIKTRKKAAETR